MNAPKATMAQTTFWTVIRPAALAILCAGLPSFATVADFKDRDANLFHIPTPKPLKADKDVVVVIMREGIPRGGGYTYQYPRENPEPVMTDEVKAQEGDLTMRVELVASDYSGAAICIAGVADMTPFMEEGTLEFWIKGETGEENALFVLVDDGVKSNGESLQVKLRSKGLGGISKEWKKVIIPVKMFGNTGVYWDAKNLKEVLLPFNWSSIKGFRVEVRKDENKEFKVWIDDVVLKKKGPEYQGPAGYPYRNVL